MGLMDYLKTQLLDIIQWEDDSRDTLSWRFPDEDKEIKRGAQLIVRESQVAQLVMTGRPDMSGLREVKCKHVPNS